MAASKSHVTGKPQLWLQPGCPGRPGICAPQRSINPGAQGLAVEDLCGQAAAQRRPFPPALPGSQGPGGAAMGEMRDGREVRGCWAQKKLEAGAPSTQG